VSLDILSLIVILLPGYWSLRVYERICFEDIHEEGDHSQFLLGLSLGIANLILGWSLSNSCLFLLSGISSLHIDFGQYYWSLPEIFENGALFMPHFLIILGLLVVLSPFTGTLWGILQRSSLSPVEWIISKVCKKMEIGSRTKNSDNINFIMDECLNSEPCFVRITTKESSSPVIGFLLAGNSAGIVLIGDGNLAEDFDFFNDPRKITYVNFESGVEVEYCTARRSEQLKYFEEHCLNRTS